MAMSKNLPIHQKEENYIKVKCLVNVKGIRNDRDNPTKNKAV